MGIFAISEDRDEMPQNGPRSGEEGGIKVISTGRLIDIGHFELHCTYFSSPKNSNKQYYQMNSGFHW